MPPRISAIVCTQDRAAYLAKALRSLAAQTLVPDAYEVVVVDNASRDETPAVIAAAARGAVPLIAVHEARRGLAHARNAGLRAAGAPFVAYLDDDAIASPAWLATLLAVFEEERPTPGCAGGRVDPIWEAPRPAWLSDALLPYLTVVDWTPAPGVLEEPRYIAGANLAFARAALEAVGGFAPELGRVGSVLLSNEEILVERRLRRRGYTCYYHPAAAVAHHVPASRLDRRWFLDRFWWQGVSDAVLETLDDRRPAWRRIARGMRRGLLPALRGWRPGGAASAHPAAFLAACQARHDLAYGLGLLRGARRG
ncbi:MAG: glycosyltransferase family 2 protein [bacterium]|nr:glycosyltransferase family 2 protein [bacterium]